METFLLNGKLSEIMAEILKIPQSMITDDLTMKDVKSWDSLKHMELIVCLEKNFCIELTFDEIVAMGCVQGIKRVLSARGVQS